MIDTLLRPRVGGNRLTGLARVVWMLPGLARSDSVV